MPVFKIRITNGKRFAYTAFAGEDVIFAIMDAERAFSGTEWRVIC
jgi:hypothetical protein